MNPRDDIIISYGDLADGMVMASQMCPFCRGGTHGERSLSAGRAGAFLWWRCHRASCGARGKERLHGSGEATNTDESRGRWHREVRRQEIPSKLKRELSEQYHIQPETMDLARWSYTPSYQTETKHGVIDHGPRVIFPIRRANGSLRGEHFRSYAGHEPKGLSNVELTENTIGWYKFKKYGKILVITEDHPSALRVAQANVDACTLMGTTLNLDRILEIRDEEYARVWLSLDRDATDQAVRYMKEFSPFLSTLRIKPLEGPDIKDMSPPEFDLYINEVLRV